MATTQTFVPQGFFAGRHPMISEALAQRIARLGGRVPPQRLIVLKAAGAKDEALAAFFAERPRWGARPKVPGAWEIDVSPDDIAQITGRKDLFRWVDIGTRLFGKTGTEVPATVAVRLAAKGGDAPGAEAAVRELGGTVSGKKGGTIEAKLAAAKAADLLRSGAIEAVEVVG
jgi:hypothetical protein